MITIDMGVKWRPSHSSKYVVFVLFSIAACQQSNPADHIATQVDKTPNFSSENADIQEISPGTGTPTPDTETPAPDTGTPTNDPEVEFCKSKGLRPYQGWQAHLDHARQGVIISSLELPYPDAPENPRGSMTEGLFVGEIRPLPPPFPPGYDTQTTRYLVPGFDNDGNLTRVTASWEFGYFGTDYNCNSSVCTNWRNEDTIEIVDNNQIRVEGETLRRFKHSSENLGVVNNIPGYYQCVIAEETRCDDIFNPGIELKLELGDAFPARFQISIDNNETVCKGRNCIFESLIPESWNTLPPNYPYDAVIVPHYVLYNSNEIGLLNELDYAIPKVVYGLRCY